MKVNRSVEHAAIVLLMLALQEGHRPVKSHVLSGIMGVSDSYLKKTLRKLTIGGLINSCASKDGGFQLSRSIDTISFADVYRALEPEGLSFRNSPLSEVVFPDDNHVDLAVEKVSRSFEESYQAFLAQLNTYPLSDLLEEGAWEQGCIDWATRLINNAS